jgi:hypothetical protein
MDDDDERDGEYYSSSWSGGIIPRLGSSSSNNSSSTTAPITFTNCSDYLTRATPAYQDPNRHKIPRTVAFLLHMGKASGGSVRLRSSRWWNLYMQECHIDPCRHFKPIDLANQTTTVLITIRDPIDRFVSAFYYASVMAGVEYDKRYAKECRHRPPANSNNNTSSTMSSDFCQLERMENYRILDKYSRNINNFAAALCGGGDPTTNEASSIEEAKKDIHEEAKKDIQVMFHIRQSILDWIASIPGTDIMEKKKAVYPIVLEKPPPPPMATTTTPSNATTSSSSSNRSAFDLNAQIDDAMRWLLRKSQMVNDTMHRETYVKFKDCKVAEAEAEAQQQQQQQHSTPKAGKKNDMTQALLTAKQHGSTKSPYYVPLDETKYTPCLVNFFQSDYHVIREMAYDLGNCRGNVQCQGALESIWNRRSPHLLVPYNNNNNNNNKR